MPGRPERSALTVGIRQLKAGLSSHLRRVQQRQTIEVTDRGRVIAGLCQEAGELAERHA